MTLQGRKNVEKIIDQDDPYAGVYALVVLSWMHLLPKEKLPELEVKRVLWRPVFRWICKIVRNRLARGRQVLIEHAWGSEAWNDTDLYHLLNEAPQDVLTFEPLQAVRANANMDFAINILDPGDHYHQTLEGGSRCRKAQDWPRELCQAIIEGFIEALDTTYTRAAFPAKA